MACRGGGSWRAATEGSKKRGLVVCECRAEGEKKEKVLYAEGNEEGRGRMEGRRDGGMQRGRGKGRQNEVRGFVRPALGGSNKTC